MNEVIRVLIADDHAIVREGLRALIGTEPDMELVGEAVDGDAAVSLFLAMQPDVALIDLIMPRKDGIAAILEIKQHKPNAHILVLTSFAEDDKVFRALKAGAQGYLLKDSSPDDLLQGIRNVHRGESFLHPTIAAKLIHELNHPADLPLTPEPLSERESQVLSLIAEGLSNHEIASRLTITDRTVGNHVGNILTKLHVANRTQAALYALRKGLAKLDTEST